MRKITVLLLLTLCSTSCVVVKEYDKVYLNDDEMMLSAKNSEQFETNFQIYREASSGANGGKTGGGCGCN
ncbi:DUF4266 domain-containing protein [Cellulophaga sp. HaHaR_3_176]|uniref:DUF4266 domain-containing protein n=1 Tax=Cellulophaga sp. HaHaR_3_176 TaxID=1942464 RepID=UPI001C1FA073|nr:DUF4266 domain-containing protein [Cellulophaga sp. HaHaR_3_176]QWX82788.1 DUF4266 domain-containing protein [Cellulophaga sp. HaHaR_3_176]